MDRATNWLEIFPSAKKSSEETQMAFRWFQGYHDVIQNLYSDNAPELVHAAATMGISHDTSTPYNSPTNGIAERAIRKVLDGTRTLLEQSGLGPRWWPMASRHFTAGLNTTQVDGRSPFQTRFKRLFPGLKVPFGALVDVRPPKIFLDQLPKLGPRSVPAVFLGYHFTAGGRWRGEYLAAPLCDFELSSTRKFVRIFRIKEVVFSTNTEIRFPLRNARDAETRVVHRLNAGKAGREVADDESPPLPPPASNNYSGDSVLPNVASSSSGLSPAERARIPDTPHPNRTLQSVEAPPPPAEPPDRASGVGGGSDCFVIHRHVDDETK